ncbi:MAG: peptide-methionine (S)-S-oxide reductase, partial [Rhodothermales bacterium]|nr:peptide-methionine (S)-S-oxide reductase [Rhodothermales bacterium]
KNAAEQVIANVSSEFPAPIVTELAPLSKFYPAEADHQDYYNNNRAAGYCRVVIDPKVAKLRSRYADKLKAELV